MGNGANVVPAVLLGRGRRARHPFGGRLVALLVALGLCGSANGGHAPLLPRPVPAPKAQEDAAAQFGRELTSLGSLAGEVVAKAHGIEADLHRKSHRALLHGARRAARYAATTVPPETAALKHAKELEAAAAAARAAVAETVAIDHPPTHGPPTLRPGEAHHNVSKPTIAPTLQPESASANHSTPVALANVLQQLRNDQKMVLKLEGGLTKLHGRLNMAEEHLVLFSHSINYANQQMFNVASRARNNSHHLRKLQRHAAQLNMSLELSDYNINITKPVAKDASKNAKSTADSMKSVVPEDNIAKLQTLTEKLWKVTDPNDPDSIDVQEKRTQVMAGQLYATQKTLYKRVRDLMVKRLRRGSNEMRRALKRLSTADADGDGSAEDDDDSDN